MATDSRMLPIDGEILGHDRFTGPVAHDACQEVEDVSFETILPGPGQARPVAPAVEMPSHERRSSQFTENHAATMRVLKGGEIPSEPRGGFLRKNGGPAFWAGGFALAACSFWFAGGHALVSAGPPAGSPAFVISHVASVIEGRAGARTLRVDATVENRSTGALALPTLLLDVHGPDGSVQHYKLGTNLASLKAGASHLFSSSLAAPTVGVARVSVRLDTTGDG